MRRSDCPDANDLAAAIEGRADEALRGAIVGHLLSCEECREVLAETMRAQEAGAPLGALRSPDRTIRAPGWWARRSVRVGGVLAASAAVVLLGLLLFSRLAEKWDRSPDRVDVLVEDLVRATGAQRRTEGRVSGGFLWAPKTATRGGGGSKDEGSIQPPAWDLAAAASRIAKAAKAHPDPEHENALGMAHLLLGDLDEAVRALESAVRRQPLQAAFHSDLAAALLERAGKRNDAQDLVHALDEAEAAMHFEPGRPEAAFNQALALEKLHLTEDAAKAWESYLRIDSTSPWAAEARERLGALRNRGAAASWDSDGRRLRQEALARQLPAVRSLASLHAQSVERQLLKDTLGGWVRASAEGRPEEAERQLRAAETIASALQNVTGDRLYLDSVKTITSSLADGDRLEAQRSGIQEFVEGMGFYDRLDGASARMHFTHAVRTLRAARNPLSEVAALQVAICDYIHADMTAAAGGLEAVRNEALRLQAPVLKARAERMLGLIATIRGRPGDSLPLYRSALATFDAARMSDNAVSTRFLLAASYDGLGDRGEEWRWTLDGLSLFDQFEDAKRASATLMETAIAAMSQGFPQAAIRFQERALALARRESDPAAMADGLLWLALARSRAGDLSGARSSLTEARIWADRVADEEVRRRTEANLLACEGEILNESDRPKAETALTGALRYFEDTGADMRLAELRVRRGRLRLASGAEDDAETDFLAAVRAVEEGRSAVARESLRISFFDTAREVYDEVVGFEAVRRGLPDRALEFAERGRARTLLDRMAPAPMMQREGDPAPSTAPLTSEQIRDAVPRHTGLIYYYVLPDRLLVWTIATGSMGFSERPVTRDQLRALVEDFRASLAAARNSTLGSAGDSPDHKAWREQAAQLYDLLVRPALDRLPGIRALVILPDGPLDALPFAALVDRNRASYLIDYLSVTFAPSASLFLRPGDSEATPPGDGPVLVVGNPAFSREIFQDLSDLPGGLVEADRVAGLYPAARRLVGPEATRKNILLALHRAEMFHFAGHALTNDRDPALSSLVVAADSAGGDPGNLYAGDLEVSPFPNLRLVVLAGCRTGIGKFSPGEGLLSLARPFLGAGVPAVLVSLWDVDDPSSVEMTTRFHRHWKEISDPAEALRLAQKDMMASSEAAYRSPAAWAAWQVVAIAQGRPASGEKENEAHR